MTSSGNEWSGFQRALGDFTFSLTAKLIVASLSKKLNNLVKSTKKQSSQNTQRKRRKEDYSQLLWRNNRGLGGGQVHSGLHVTSPKSR